MKFFSYYKDNNLVNFSNSILKKYGVKTFHTTIPEIDNLLKNHCKIALFLFDGLGKSIVEKALPEDSFLRKHFFKTISSTFPPTTVAATNSFKSGKYPAETGWLGWTFLDKRTYTSVEYFTHKNYETNEPYEYNYERFGYESIFDMIRKNNENVVVLENYPIEISDNGNTKFDTIQKMLDNVDEVLDNSSNCLIYSYNLEPDRLLHKVGINHPDVLNCIKEIDAEMEKFAKKHKDTLIIVFADHSHILVDPIFYYDQDELVDSVNAIYSFDSRCANFSIKEGKTLQFLNYFEKNLKNKYVLVSKKEAIESKLFGNTNETKWLDEFIGDYILVSNTDYFFDRFKDNPMISQHGGGTEAENLINIFAINKK